MSSAIVAQENSSALAQWDSEQMTVIREQIAPDCNEPEILLFAQVCKQTGLDPFSKQIYAISRWDKRAGRKKMTIQTSIDGYRLIADRTKNYAGSETYWCGRDGNWRDVWLEDEAPAAAKTVVYRKDSDRPFVGVARFKSYVQTDKDGNTMGLWRQLDDVMIAKCSESLALRKAFPNNLSGLYTKEEMMQADMVEAIDVQVSTVQPARLPSNPITQRFNFVAGKTGHDKEGAIAAATAVGVPPSSKQMNAGQFILFRNRLLAEWGMNMGAFKAVNHAMNSLKHVDGFDGPNDAAVWDAWEVKVGMKLAEAKPVDAEFIPAGEDLLGTPSLGINEIQEVGA